MTDIADKLREARALIERGWTRGEYCRAGRHCLLGAIKKAFGVPYDARFESNVPSHAELTPILLAALGSDRPFHEFNDEQKSKKPILAFLDKAIELVEARQ